ncbi:MAG TPA: DUF418 domain-containing protein, partial [Rubrobacter sp.]|nr:DUF418 domain-containing protein [Rubrobacter sp.]
ERIQTIDALRGFALFGILVVNMAAFRAPVFDETGLDAGVLDRVVTWLIAFGFEQKFYVLFSFLFGYGLSVQMFRAAERGSPLVPRFLRRLLGLLLIGLAHAVLLYTGDILVTYALLGVVLLLMRNVSSRVLLLLAAGLVLLSALAFALSGTVFATGDNAAFEAELRAESERSVEAYRGTPAAAISERIRTYPGTLGFALVGQGPTALAMFLVGLWAGRRRLFERVEDHLPLLRRALVVGLVVGVAGALVWASERAVSGFAFDEGFFLAASVDFLTAPFLTAAYVVAITFLYRSPGWRRRLAFLVPVGRAALSNYLFQSLVAALIFTGYGLGLYGRVDAGLGLLLSFAIFAAQIPLSAWWMSRFAFGPAEWVLRSFTYARLQPIRVRLKVPQTPP